MEWGFLVGPAARHRPAIVFIGGWVWVVWSGVHSWVGLGGGMGFTGGVWVMDLLLLLLPALCWVGCCCC